MQTQTLWVQELVRTGAIQLSKAKGFVNPADPFTKHSTSRERVTQVVELFNCECRDGRAKAAPLLRKEKIPTTDASHAATVHDDDDNNAEHTHDPDVLSHTYTFDDLEALFPRAVAPEDPYGAPSDQCICCLPGCSKCSPPRPC